MLILTSKYFYFIFANSLKNSKDISRDSIVIVYNNTDLDKAYNILADYETSSSFKVSDLKFTDLKTEFYANNLGIVTGYYSVETSHSKHKDKYKSLFSLVFMKNEEIGWQLIKFQSSNVKKGQIINY